MEFVKKYVKLSELRPAEYNPRKASRALIDSLKLSISTFGLVEPLILNSRSGRLVGGHQRLKALEELYGKDFETEVVVVELDDGQERALNVALNKITGDWDDGKLVEVLRGISVFDPGLLSKTGFSEQELAKMLGTDPESDGDLGEYDEVKKTCTTVRGDVFVLGRHRIMCGDATSAADVKVLFGEVMADLVFTSPPYNVDMGYNEYADSKTEDEYGKLMLDVMRSCYANMKAGRLLCWNVGASAKTNLPLQYECVKSAGFWFYRQVVWAKTGIAKPIWQNSTNKPLARHYLPNYMHEMIIIASKGEVEYGESCEMPYEASGDVWKINASTATRDIETVVSSVGNPNYGGEHKKKAHPAVFPLMLPLLAIKTLSAPEEVVYDPFGGSGTTVMACEKSNRKGLMMELDPVYVEITIKRWESLTGNKADKVTVAT